MKRGDLAGVSVAPEQIIELRCEPLKRGPRQEPAYQDACLEAVGLGKSPDLARYKHILESPTAKVDVELLRWAVRRGSGCMWLPDSPRTSAMGVPP